MVLRYIGSAVTDSNGNAVLEDGYTGTGAGEIDVVAKTEIDDSIIQSETYSIQDYLVYDKATTGEKSTDWTPNGVSESVGDDGTTLTGAINRYTSTKALTGDFELLVEMKNNGNFRFGLVDAQVSKLAEIFTNNPNGVYVKITRNGSSVKFYLSNNGTNWTEQTLSTSTLTTEDCYVYFHILVAERTITYKNLKAYKI